MKNLKLIYLFLSISTCIFAEQAERFRVICYNVENYFDCLDDTLKNDSEYLRGGMRGWSTSKYRAKQVNIAKVITAIGGWETPALVGLCEVENRYCMVGLTKYSGLKSLNYKFIHHESPDFRGIDVVLLYHARQFKPLHDEAIEVRYADNGRATRDILYVKGLALKTDTLHVFVCHLSSRWGGELESESRRIYAAAIVRQRTDSILLVNPNANILIMGDFNDYPNNKSMAKVIGARPLSEMPTESKLYNMMFHFEEKNQGTYKYHDGWGCLDQIIISENLLTPESNIHTSQKDTYIFRPDFLLEEDKKFLGEKPFRTYIGYKYNGGFSDHLPAYIDLWIKK